LGQLGHIRSYYAASANTAPERPALAEDIDCDVCVVGAGLTGLSAALHLAERGYDVVVLEANRVGWGASGRSGGQIIFGYGCEMGVLKRMLTRREVQLLWDLSLEAVALVKERIARHDIHCDLKPGHLHVAIKPRQRVELAAWREQLAEGYGYRELALLEGETLEVVVRSRRYIAGVLDPNSAHLHPLNYTLGLASAAAKAGARICEGSRVTAIEPGPAPVARTAAGRVHCRHLVLAGNAYLDGLDPALRGRIMPVGTYIIATEPLGEARARSLIPGDAAVADINFVLDYFRRSGDHRLLFGGRVSYSTMQPPNLERSMRNRMLKVFPELADVRIDYAWGGRVAITMNRAPDLGRLGLNVFYAQGFSGHGMALTGLAGKLIAEAVAGTAERFDVFTRIRHRPFPGGRRLRMPLLVLAMAYYRLRDLL
jgi:gamma-glutamylputrescine oxidase